MNEERERERESREREMTSIRPIKQDYDYVVLEYDEWPSIK
jgi:hypothetical protein